MLQQQFISGGLQPTVESLRMKDTPSEADYQRYEEAGVDLAQAISNVETKRRAAMNNNTAKALGKLSSGLYLVTAAHDDAKSAMIASWVQQASFQPLGLTVAIAKDRAIEAFM